MAIEAPKAKNEPAKTVVEEIETDDDGFIKQPVAAKPAQKGPFLVGRSDVGTERIVTRADFASKEIDQDTLTFKWEDGFKIPLKGINPEAVEFLTEVEYGFSVSDE